VTDCPKLAEDMAKIFQVYWDLGGEGVHIPDRYINGFRTICQLYAKQSKNYSNNGTPLNNVLKKVEKSILNIYYSKFQQFKKYCLNCFYFSERQTNTL